MKYGRYSSNGLKSQTNSGITFNDKFPEYKAVWQIKGESEIFTTIARASSVTNIKKGIKKIALGLPVTFKSITLVKKSVKNPVTRPRKLENSVTYWIIDKAGGKWKKHLSVKDYDKAESLVASMNKKAGEDRFQVVGFGVDD